MITTALARPTRGEVAAMSDAEFRVACSARAWRRPAENAASESRQAGERGIVPTPAALHQTGVKYALTLTDAEFDAACKARAWRTGQPNR